MIEGFLPFIQNATVDILQPIWAARAVSRATKIIADVAAAYRMPIACTT